MAYGKMGEKRKIVCISSSIGNFKQKILRKEVRGYRLFDLGRKVYFIGLYHPFDYLRFIFHRGERVVIWCGSDILNLQNSIWRFFIPLFQAQHYCENVVCKSKLYKLRIDAKIEYSFLEDPKKYSCAYKFGKTKVFICAHPGREEEYGLLQVRRIAKRLPNVIFHLYGIGICGIIEGNIVFHGQVPTEQFDKEIKNYHACLRLNEFDGFGECLQKSVLLGQYPISRIKYPYIDSYSSEDNLVELIKKLRYKRVPNYLARDYWLNVFNNNILCSP